jgi:hypothetical protein
MQTAQNIFGGAGMIQLCEDRGQPQCLELVVAVNFREKAARILEYLRLHNFDVFNGCWFNANLHKVLDSP